MYQSAADTLEAEKLQEQESAIQITKNPRNDPRQIMAYKKHPQHSVCTEDAFLFGLKFIEDESQSFLFGPYAKHLNELFLVLIAELCNDSVDLLIDSGLLVSRFKFTNK